MEIIEPREVKYAGFWLRLAAYIIDYIVLQLVVGIMSLPFMVGMITGIIAASKEARTTLKAEQNIIMLQSVLWDLERLLICSTQ